MLRKYRILREWLRSILRDDQRQRQAIDHQIRVLNAWNNRPDRAKNPLTSNPRSYFSQSDEDGILEKILARLHKTDSGTVIEFGPGSGSENNSLALLAKGWSGYWIGAVELCFTNPASSRLGFSQSWVTAKNILDHIRTAYDFLGSNEIDVVSLDLDGNDFTFTQMLLEYGLKPDVWICEYNAKFPLGVEWVMQYDENHAWAGDDYYGASFTSFTKLFQEHGYFPVACSIQGANVFFVKSEFRSLFQDIPLAMEDIFEPAGFHLVRCWGHPASGKTLASLMAKESS